MYDMLTKEVVKLIGDAKQREIMCRFKDGMVALRAEMAAKGLTPEQKEPYFKLAGICYSAITGDPRKANDYVDCLIGDLVNRAR